MRVFRTGGFSEDDDDDMQLPGKKETDFDYVPTLTNFLAAYTPAATVHEADKFFTTQEIIAKVEQHLGMIRRSDPFGIDNGINGTELVTEISALGFKAVNVGGTMQWLMKKKVSSSSNDRGNSNISPDILS